MIKLGDKNMKPALMKLWRDVFGDPQEYVDLFFTHRFRPSGFLGFLSEGGFIFAHIYFFHISVQY